jgi:transcriptional regulator with XRE-family HTH domain
MAKQAETFADRLRSLREAAGLSQYRLAQLAGVTKQTVSRLELGTVQPSWESVQALARGLGVDVGAFVVAVPHPEVRPGLPRGRPRKQQGEGEKPAAKKLKRGAK